MPENKNEVERETEKDESRKWGTSSDHSVYALFAGSDFNYTCSVIMVELEEPLLASSH